MKGWKVRGEIKPFQGFALNLTIHRDNKQESWYQADLRVNLLVKDFRLKSIASAMHTAAEPPAPSLDTRALDRVERNFNIQVERWSETTGALLWAGNVDPFNNDPAKDGPDTPGTSTGITVIAGHSYRYTASGTICIGFGLCYGPEGTGNVADDTVLQGHPDFVWVKEGLIGFSLIGRIDMSNNFIQLGSAGTFVAPATGELRLYIDDYNIPDNSGSWAVTISSVD
jgi:hypothetical protein